MLVIIFFNSTTSRFYNCHITRTSLLPAVARVSCKINKLTAGKRPEITVLVCLICTNTVRTNSVYVTSGTKRVKMGDFIIS